jgi:hypothetical protein
MTVEPLKERTPATKMEANKRMENELRPIDFRTLKVQFFTNNTFSAIGVNKILRGRFHVERAEEDIDADDDTKCPFILAMDVSIFGAGRSAPGSVYSEGLGLTHDDERTYTGTIQQQFLKKGRQKRLYVQGTVYYGTDLGDDARPEPVAEFFLTEDSASNCKVVGDGDDLVTFADDDDDQAPYSATGGVFE